MELTGKIIAILPPKQGVPQSTGNAWICQHYVLETQETYPKKCCFNVFGAEKIKDMNIQLGETLTVSLEINASEYQGKWYNQVRAWKVERMAQAQQAAVVPQGCQVIYQNHPSRSPQGGTSQQRPQAPMQQPAADEATGLPF